MSTVTTAETQFFMTFKRDIEEQLSKTITVLKKERISVFSKRKCLCKGKSLYEFNRFSTIIKNDYTRMMSAKSSKNMQSTFRSRPCLLINAQ